MLIDQLTQDSLRAKYNPEGSVMRNAQHRLLEMLLYIKDVCEILAIEWRLDGGNVLGAVRHGGFIPWDDDIDVVMEVKEFRRFCDYCKQHPNPRFVLQDHDTDKSFFMHGWAYLRDLNSEYIFEDNPIHNSYKYRGLSIDIFCYERNINVMMLKIASWIHGRITLGLSIRHSKVANVLWYVEKYSIIPMCRCIGYLAPCADMYAHAYGSFVDKLIPLSCVYPLKELEFEGYKFPFPGDAQGFCEILYGKHYYELPSDIDRKTHSINIKMW